VLRIRLRRVGKKKQPNYRLVVADSRAPRDGAFIETIGTYNPLTQPATITVKEDRVRDWISKGAVPSDRAAKILSERGLCEPPKFTPKAKQEKPKDEPAAAPAAEAPAAAPVAEAATDADAPEEAPAEAEAAAE
jgi:small subunit ribosomal protein S16